jgi:hypothetical protein
LIDVAPVAVQKCCRPALDCGKFLQTGKWIMISLLKRTLRSLCILAIAATAVSESASAACYAPDQQMSPQAVSDFMSNAAGLLGKPENAKGGSSMIDAIRDLVASNPATLPLVIGLLKSANEDQQKAIGTGLGLAANLCARPDPNFAADISQQLAQSTGNDAAKTTYAAIIGKATGSVAGGGAGGVSGGSVGGSTTPITNAFGSSSTPTAFTSGGAFTTGTNFFTGGGAAGAGSVSFTTSTTTTNTASNSVSK